MPEINEQEILNQFIDVGALLKGHFVLSSGLHSDTYLQCAKIMMYPAIATKLCTILVENIRLSLEKISIDLHDIDVIAAPAMGGLMVGYEIARQLNKPSIFCERVDGKFQLRRGFAVGNNDKILVIEDVVTTGKSSLEARDCLIENGGLVVAVACLVNRSNDNFIEDLLLISLLNLAIDTYSNNELPENLAKLPISKPGSRFIKK